MRAVLFDALGTLVALEPPGPRLRAALIERAGVDVGERAAREAFAAEIAYYLDHHTEGDSVAGLEHLRDDCAAVLHEALGVAGLDRDVVRAAMLASLRFTAFPDAAPALRELRRRGLRLVVLSNWDRSLPERLDEAGLLALVDETVASAEAGAAKPAPGAFEAALERAGVGAVEAVHVGDSLANDVEGARAAGVRAVLLERECEPPGGVECVRRLTDLLALL